MLSVVLTLETDETHSFCRYPPTGKRGDSAEVAQLAKLCSHRVQLSVVLGQMSPKLLSVLAYWATRGSWGSC
jgi:hypothetical protein